VLFDRRNKLDRTLLPRICVQLAVLGFWLLRRVQRAIPLREDRPRLEVGMQLLDLSAPLVDHYEVALVELSTASASEAERVLRLSLGLRQAAGGQQLDIRSSTCNSDFLVGLRVHHLVLNFLLLAIAEPAALHLGGHGLSLFILIIFGNVAKIFKAALFIVQRLWLVVDMALRIDLVLRLLEEVGRLERRRDLQHQVFFGLL